MSDKYYAPQHRFKLYKKDGSFLGWTNWQNFLSDVSAQDYTSIDDVTNFCIERKLTMSLLFKPDDFSIRIIEYKVVSEMD